jgi:hypothetical protein
VTKPTSQLRYQLNIETLLFSIGFIDFFIVVLLTRLVKIKCSPLVPICPPLWYSALGVVVGLAVCDKTVSTLQRESNLFIVLLLQILVSPSSIGRHFPSSSHGNDIGFGGSVSQQ